MNGTGITPQVYNLIATTVGKAICQNATSCGWPDPNVIVLLTDELADHIVDMYYNTNWDSMEYDAVELPDEFFIDEVDLDKWKEHVGEHILISRYGQPWIDILDSPVFVPGVEISLVERLMYLAVDDVDDLCTNQGQEIVMDLLDHLFLVIHAKLADGIPEKALQRMLELEFTPKAH